MDKRVTHSIENETIFNHQSASGCPQTLIESLTKRNKEENSADADVTKKNTDEY